MSKENLRKILRERLNNFNAEEKKSKELSCLSYFTKLLGDLSLLSSDKTIGLFAPLSDEIDIVSGLKGQGFKLAFPSVNDLGQMVFRESRYEDLIEKSSFKVKIFEPRLECLEIDPDILVVPGLAFGRNGERLGRGKGYYDKYLKNYKGITIGLSFDEQLIAGIPMEDHDCYLNWIVTDKEIIEV
ncbi:5-formyltetrahydrofolate cyclo-ligase [Halobacteriovorax marinus]|uniref:5-formyltetrahydrofolate cyclo-ligase n=1 Tax=Halobacteriovorax marinus TaxID=97084 RepID=UPI003A93F341